MSNPPCVSGDELASIKTVCANGSNLLEGSLELGLLPYPHDPLQITIKHRLVQGVVHWPNEANSCSMLEQKVVGLE